MSETIKGAGDIYQKDLYGDLGKSAKETLPLIEKLNQVLIETTKSNEKLIESEAKDVAGLKKVETGIKQTNKAFEQKIKLDKEKIKLEEKLKANRTKQAQQNEVIKQNIQFETRERKKLAKETLKLTGAYTKESNKLNDLRKKYKDLAVSEKGVSKEQTVLLSQITRLDTKLKKIDRTVGQSQRNVGNYKSALKGVGSSLKGILLAGGVAGVVLGIGRAFKDAFGRIREFDKEINNLAGISGLTRDELKSTEQQIISVAGSSTKTSNEVAKLATTLFSLGKNQDEVNKLLKPVNDLSISLGATSDEAGELLVSTLNAFGKGADSGLKFADTIAKIRTSTSLNFERIKDSLGFVSATANVLNLSLGETGALIGVLQDNGVKGARAGRLLNSSFIKLAKEGKTLEGSLDRINKAQERGAKGSELLRIAEKDFGTQSASLGVILSKNRDRIKELSNEFDNLSQGSLKKLTDEQLKSTDAQLKILDSTWESFILQVDSGNGVISEVVKGFVSLATGIIESITPIETITDSLQTQADSLNNMVVSLNDVNTNTSTRLSIMENLNKEYPTLLKNLGFEKLGLDNVAEAVDAVNKNLLERVAVSDAVADVTDSNNALSTVQGIQQETINKFIVQGTKNLIENNKADLLKNKTLQEQIPIIQENQTTWQSFTNSLETAENRQRGANVSIKQNNELFEENQKLVLQLLESREDLDNLTTIELRNLVKSKLLKGTELESLAREIIIIRERKKAKEDELKVDAEIENIVGEGTKKRAKQARILTGLIEKQSKVVSDLNKEIQRATSEQDIFDLSNKVDIAKKELDRLNRIVSSSREEFDKRSISLIQDDIDRTIAGEKAKSEAVLKAIRTNATTNIPEKQELIALETKRLNDFTRKQELKRENERIKRESDFFKASIDQKRTGFETEKEFEEFKADQLRGLRLSVIDEEISALKKFGDSKSDLRIKELEAEKEGFAEFAKDTKKDFGELQQAILNKIEESIAKRSEKRLEEIDKQIEGAEKNENRLKDLAEKGSLDAQKSIAEEQKKQAQLKLQRQKEERKQELITAGFKVFSALLEQGKNPASATLETTAILGALPAIIEAIPSFYEGTENTGTVSKPLDSNGGRLSVLHDNERVLTSKQNKQIGNVSNNEVANIVENHKKGLFSDLYNFNQPSIDGGLLDSINLNGLNKGLERKIDTLNESIKRIKIPETTVKADELRNLLVITKKTGNKIEIQRSKLH